MPISRDLAMMLLISCTSPLKIRSEISGELSMISTAAARPLPSFFGISRCDTSARMFREEVDDPVERLVGTVGVQRGHAQVPRLGKRDRMVHGLTVADFADQDH